MTQLETIQDFYQNGTDPDFSPNPNHVFINMTRGGDRTILIPGHFYTHTELEPIGPDQVPTWDEYELLKYPSVKDVALAAKYRVKKPYYDNRPIFLALSPDGLGLNVKLMSQPLRKRFIRTYLNKMSTPLANCFEDGNLMEFNKRIRERAVAPFFTVDTTFIKTLLGMPDIKFNLLVNKYNREKMRNLTLIDWDTVPNLHLANYSTDRTISARSSFSLFEIK
jgi:hypothetical protein